MIKRENIFISSTYDYTGKMPKMFLTNDNFYGGFGILGQTGDPMVNPFIYYATATYWSRKKENRLWNWERKTIELETCKLEKFGNKYQDIFKHKDLDNMYCFKNLNVTLEGSATSNTYSYFEINLYLCLGNNNCWDKSIQNNYLRTNNFMFLMQDIELTPQLYKLPVQPIEKDISGPIYSTLYQQTYLYFQETIIETNEDIFGFGSSNIKKEKI